MGASAMAMANVFQGTSAMVGGINQASAMRMQGDYQKQMYDANSRIADLQAKDATARGEVAAGNVARETSQRVGAQRAAAAASGIDATSGSAASVQASTEAIGAVNELNVKNNAWREAWGYKVQSSNDTFQGAMAKNAANNSANNTLLTGGLNAASSFAKAGYAMYGNGGGGNGSDGIKWAGGDSFAPTFG